MKKILVVFLLFFCLGTEAKPISLQPNDIQRVTERFFHFHIENKEWSPLLVRRLMKLYIEQFDPDKSYLLEQEVLPWVQLSDRQALQILERLQSQDYSDFVSINQLFQKAVERFRANRQSFVLSVSAAEGSWGKLSSGPFSHFARSSNELARRQESHMVRFFLYHQSRTHLDTWDRKAKVFVLFDKKMRRIENQYLAVDSLGKPLDPEKSNHLFALRILKAFAKSLDTHTSFFSPEEAHEMRHSLEKQFEGVGIILSEGIDGFMIVELIEGSPAHQSGSIAVNDLLVEIDGRSVEQLQFHEVLELLKQKDRGKIILGFKRGQEEIFHVELMKRPITMQGERIETSYEEVERGIIGKISLHSFYESSDGESSEKDIKEAIRSFQAKGELLGLVLDLRGNSGGFLSQAVKVTGLFVSNGVIVISKYGRGEIHYLRNITAKTFYSGPLIVLTSKMSASAAEIVAQALQDYGVALVIGDERTFGKGSIQYQTITDPSADYFFKVTVGRYYTVSGRSTQIEGVVADIVLPGKYAPYKIGERYLEFPLSPDHASPAFIDPLTDLDERNRPLFEKRYLPYLQRVVHYWKKMIPTLRHNIQMRLARNAEYTKLLKLQESSRARIAELPVNTIDDQIQLGLDELQMQEAVQIVKDMLYLEAEKIPQPTALLDTGTD